MRNRREFGVLSIEATVNLRAVSGPGNDSRVGDEPVKHRLLDDPAIAQMFNDDPLEQGWRDPGVPHALGVHDDDGTARADAKARGFAPLHPTGSEEQAFALQQGGEQAVELSPRLIGRAEAADTYENVSGVGLHRGRERCGGHGWTIS